MIEARHFHERESLFEKTQGPNAVPLDRLVLRGEVAAQRARADFPEFLQTQAPVVMDTAKNLHATPDGQKHWQSCYTLVRDLRSSSASAAYHTVSAVCQSLELLLIERDRDDPLMPAVIALHLDALKLAIADKIPDEAASRSLIENLDRAVKRLNTV